MENDVSELPKVTLAFWASQMKEAEAIFRKAGSVEKAEGVAYARRLGLARIAVESLTPTAREPVKVTEAMVDAYLKAQAKYVMDRDRRMVEGDPQAACKAGLEAALATQPAEPGVVQYTFDIPTPSRMTINYSDGKAGLTVFGRVTITIEDELKAQEGGR
jgi:hypothetical protein